MKRFCFILSTLLIISQTGNSQIITPTFRVPNGDTICIHSPGLFSVSGSSGDSIVIEWRDGQFTTLIAPYNKVNHQYDTLGTFIIYFTAFLNGATVTDSLTITVVDPPHVDFSYSFTDTCAKQNLLVQFTDLSDPGLTNYLWNFGDGTTAGTSTLTNPNYTYGQPQSYLVSLTAQNHVCPNKVVKSLQLPYDTTLAAAISYTVGCPCNTINFSVTGTATNWFWNFGDGATANTQNVNHVFSQPGNYLVTVTGTNPLSGCEYTIAKSIDICPNDLNVFPTKSNNNWFFYQNNGLNFSGGGPVFIPGGQMNNLPGEGGATISDPTTGNLLFYTNGQKVWDKTHSQMPAGNGLNGNNSSTESALIIPKPGNINQYYIFTSSGASSGQQGCFYSLVDLTLNAGNGDLTTKNAPLYPKSGYKSEVLKGVVKKEAENCNDAEYWTIIPAGQDTFNVYPVTNTGVGAPVVNSMINPSVPSMLNRAVMASAISPNGRTYAVVEGEATNFANNRIRVMNFDISTGVLSNQQFFTPFISSIYGITFSPDNSKLYASGTDMIIQYDLLNNRSATFFPVDGIGRIMQIGQDNKIYFVIEDAGSLGVINFPNNAGSACGVNQNGVFLNGNITLQGLQNFVPLRLYIPDTLQATFSILPNTNCSLTISLNNTSDTIPPPDPCSFFLNDTASYFWSFGDGTTSTLFQPNTHTYSLPGTYNIKLVVKRNRMCTADSLTQIITVAQPPLTTTLTPTPSCDSAMVNSNWYYNSQTLRDTILGGASNGCDSIINTYITITSSSTATITPLSCGNYLSPAGNIFTLSGLYHDTIPSSPGCDSLITINLTVIDSVVTTVSANSCDSALIHGNWYFATQLVRDTLAGAAHNGCDSIIKTSLTILNSSSTNNNINTCQGQSSVIHGVNQTASGIYTQTFTSTSGCDSISSITLNVTPTAVANINSAGCDSLFANGAWHFASQTLHDTINGGSTTGCDSITNINITISTTPVLTVFPLIDSIYTGSELTLTATGANIYLWADGTTTSIINVSPTQNISYCVIGKNGNCPDTVCAQVYVLECGGGILFVPTAFSPNDDGQNDELCVYGTQCLQTFQLNIYDRWGELVCRSMDPDNCWDGNFKGKKLGSAVFTFALNGISKDKKQIELKGNITLIR